MTSSVIIEPFVFQHAQEIDARSENLATLPIGQGLQGLLVSFAQRGPFFTVRAPEGIIAIAGIVVLGPGTGEGWAVTSDLVHSYKLSLHRIVKDYLQRVVEQHGLRRVVAMAWSKHEAASNWARHLGFEQEGYHLEVNPGVDFYSFARLT